MSFKSSFWALADPRGSWLGFPILILIWIWSLVFDIPIFQILALYFNFEDAKICWGLRTWENAGGSLLGLEIPILMWIWSLVFDTPTVHIVALYLDFEGARNIYVLEVLIWVFGT